MALIKCKECGNEISNKAKSCPKCGAPVPKTSMLTIIFAVIFGAAIFNGVLNTTERSSTQVISPEDAEAKSKADEADRKRFVAAASASKAIKQSLRDPDSLKFESMRINDEATIICVEYRARNGFGGMNREFVTFVNNASKRDAETWNKSCRIPLHDYLYAVN